MADIAEELLDFSGGSMPAVQPMPVHLLIRAADEIKELRARLDDEIKDCNDQVDLVIKFANRSERLFAAGERLAVAARTGRSIDEAIENWDEVSTSWKD